MILIISDKKIQINDNYIMHIIGLLFITANSSLMSYNLYQSIGQLIQDKSNSSVYAILGSSILIESSDPILTDRGGYFNKTQYIQLNPNFISSSVPDLQNELIILTLFKVIEPGVIFTMHVENTLRMHIRYESGSLIFSRGGNTIKFDVRTCKIYLDEWIKAIIGYVSYKVGSCASSGLIIQIDGVCESLYVDPYSIKWSTHTVVRFGATSEGFTGFLGLFNVYGDYDTPNSLLSTLVNLDSNQNLYSTSTNETCNCGSYSCDSNNSNICIQCDSACGGLCNDYNSSECLNMQALCGTKLYNSGLGICFESIGNCLDQTDENICNKCEPGYYLYSNQSVCSVCHSSCVECSGPLIYDCICSGVNTYFDFYLGKCVCYYGFYDSGGSPFQCSGVCDETCHVCKGAGKSSCTECTFGKILTDGRCITCDPSCFACDGDTETNCTSCYYDRFLQEGRCIEKSCDYHCLTCSETNKSMCTSCFPPYELIDGTCSYPISCGLFCGEPCDDSCDSCLGQTSSDCLSCKKPGTSIKSPPGKCECSFGFYQDPLTSSCNPCHGSCSTCSGATRSDCLLCKSSFSYLDSRPGECLCYSGYHMDLLTYNCETCNESCLTCTGPSASNCLTCQNPDYYIQSPPGECACTKKFYFNPLTFNCEPCNESCLTCSGPTLSDCLTCKHLYNFVESPPGKCVCLSGFYLSPLTSSCQQCSTYCLTCSVSSTNCSSCNENFYLTPNYQCVKCGTGYYLGVESCEMCHESCLSCTNYSENSCLVCKNNDIVISNPPGPCACPESQYVSSKNPLVCKDCPKGCKLCFESKCFDCFYGYTLSSLQCIKNVLKLEFFVGKNHSISAVFSKALAKDLKVNDLRISIQSKTVNFTLTKIDEFRYLIRFNSFNFTNSSYKVKIEILTKIVAKDQSELEKLVYNCTFKVISGSSNTFDSIVTITNASLLIIALISAVASVFTGFQPTVIWVALNSIQLLSYIPLFNLPLPLILVKFFTSTLPINVLTNIWSRYSIINCDNSEISEKYYEYGYTCHNIITNTGKVLLSFIIGISMLIILLPLHYIPSLTFKTFIRKKIEEYKYSFFLRFWIHHFLDIAIPSMISLNFVK